ncbi:MAG: SLC13 family permease [Dehalococcoidales bacterium]|nr:SLC13 family permease [Dehalococcoidales bacterium]
MISLIVLAFVFILIAVRKVGNLRLQIWQIMSLGAAAVLVTGQIGPLNALKAINLDVLFFLFGMFIVGEALESSGYLSQFSYRVFSKARSLDTLVLAILFVMGLMSAFLMNDTLAIIGTPVVLLLAKRANTTPKILMLSLAFAITIGSVASPIGNPQNLLIAVNGEVENPFLTFFRYLLIPTVINLVIAWLFLRFFYRRHFDTTPIVHETEPTRDEKLARLCKVSLGLLVALILLKIAFVFAGTNLDFRLTYIALAAAFPIVAFSPRRLTIVRKIDWFTLVFFAAMFILMESVWDSGVVQGVLTGSNLDLTSTPVILGVSILLSQFISNVPLVALYLPVLAKLGVTSAGLMALAAGSTIAGNLSILGAASNVIIIQNAEKKFGETLTFFEFVKIGVPLTVVNALVYWLFFLIIPG